MPWLVDHQQYVALLSSSCHDKHFLNISYFVKGIVGGQALRAVSTTHQIPEAVAIIIIAILTALFALFGYRYVHLYERYSWIPVVIIFFVSLGLSAKYMDSGPFAGSGEVEAASILSFGAAIVGFGLGWSSLAAGRFQ